MRDDQLEQSKSLSWVFHASLHVGGDRSALSLLFSSKLSWNFSWGPSLGHPFMELFMELSWKANLSLSTFMLHFRGILSTRPACGQAKKSAWCDFRAKMHTFVTVEPQPISEEWSGPRYQLLRCDFLLWRQKCDTKNGKNVISAHALSPFATPSVLPWPVF